MKRVLVVVAFLILFSYNFSVVTGCHDAERTALLSFRSHLTDPSNRLASWQGYNCCNWHGIYCSDSLHVVAINLRNPGPISNIINMNMESVPKSNSTSRAINGTFSSSLFALTHLRHLDLSFNNFMLSKIPSGIANLTSLAYLNLSNTMLSDSITTQFANLTSLRQLDLSCSSVVTDLSSISTVLSSTVEVHAGSLYSYVHNGNLSSSNLNWLLGLPNLRELRLSGVDLSEATQSTEWAKPISSLSNLRLLQLSDCGISGKLPANQLCNLTQLLLLQMDFNALATEIPNTLANLTLVSTLDLTNSNIGGSIPYLPQIKELRIGGNYDLLVDLHSMFALPWPQLVSLDIHSTQVIGTIPDSLGNITSLVQLVAYNSSVNGIIPSALTNLSKLETLELDYNNIVGRLPPSISSLESLKTLSLVQNHLEGFIPDSICQISSLWYLALEDNLFTGSLPDCIGQLPNLQALMVGSNNLNGTISSLPSLLRNSTPYTISLGFNSFTVEVNQDLFPTNFQPITLMLSSCQLEGRIPDFISNLAKLSFLILSNNNLTGTIPTWLFNLPSLEYLDLSFNKLQGVLPLNIKLRSYFGLTTLNLASNQLEGPVPLQFENIQVVDLSRNNFTGHIPAQIGRGKVSFLSLSDNKLSGEIPFSFCHDNNVLQLLNVSNNILSGTVPKSLGRCSSLTFLNLGGNQLSGVLPEELDHAKNISYLDMTQNQFEGLFPSFIQEFQNLMVLKLGNNNFQGKIPPFIGDLKNLHILVLESNHFSETIPQEINKLEKLQFIDLSNNSLTGPIPKNLNGLNMLKTRPKDGNILGYIISSMYAGVELNMVSKGVTYTLEVVRTYDSGIDLSFNNLTGSIPSGIGLLRGLYMLNLSHNHICGEIPESISQMSGLETLDLSFNSLKGEIPSSLNFLDFLSVVNFSYNNFSGKIPSGIRFDTWYGDGSAYIGNKFLCDVPGGMNCSSNGTFSEEETTKDSKQTILFYGVVVNGYGVGFWVYFVVLYFLNEDRKRRHWKLIDKIVEALANCIFRRRR